MSAAVWAGKEVFKSSGGCLSGAAYTGRASWKVMSAVVWAGRGGELLKIVVVRGAGGRLKIALSTVGSLVSSGLVGPPVSVVRSGYIFGRFILPQGQHPQHVTPGTPGTSCLSVVAASKACKEIAHKIKNLNLNIFFTSFLHLMEHSAFLATMKQALYSNVLFLSQALSFFLKIAEDFNVCTNLLTPASNMGKNAWKFKKGLSLDGKP